MIIVAGYGCRGDAPEAGASPVRVVKSVAPSASESGDPLNDPRYNLPPGRDRDREDTAPAPGHSVSDSRPSGPGTLTRNTGTFNTLRLSFDIYTRCSPPRSPPILLSTVSRSVAWPLLIHTVLFVYFAVLFIFDHNLDVSIICRVRNLSTRYLETTTF
ncbi:hypothetical protein G7046_g9304 [Stylonectria norvegica]|nr:hypothetical protein G7046_g9304 [Stylonectria norvegica]